MAVRVVRGKLRQPIMKFGRPPDRLCVLVRCAPRGVELAEEAGVLKRDRRVVGGSFEQPGFLADGPVGRTAAPASGPRVRLAAARVNREAGEQ
jgi:hypothetical protein